MAGAAHHQLRYTEPAPPQRFTIADWLTWFVRDESVRESRWSDSLVRVLHVGLARADADGEFDLHQSGLAAELGVTRETVQRAVRRLTRKGLIEEVGTSPTDPRIKRYRFGTCDTLSVSGDDHSTCERMRSHTCDKNVTGLRQHGVSGGAPMCDSMLSHVVPLHAQEEALQHAAGSGDPPPSAPLFDPPRYDRDAAALLRSAVVGMRHQDASHLVRRYGVTAEQLRNILANIEAKNAAAARGECDPVTSRKAFVRSAIENGRTTLDRRAAKIRREQERAEQRRRQAEAEERLRIAREAERDREAALDAAFARISEAKREALREQARAALAQEASVFSRPGGSIEQSYMRSIFEHELVRSGALPRRVKP